LSGSSATERFSFFVFAFPQHMEDEASSLAKSHVAALLSKVMQVGGTAEGAPALSTWARTMATVEDDIEKKIEAAKRRIQLEQQKIVATQTQIQGLQRPSSQDPAVVAVSEPVVHSSSFCPPMLPTAPAPTALAPILSSCRQYSFASADPLSFAVAARPTFTRDWSEPTSAASEAAASHAQFSAASALHAGRICMQCGSETALTAHACAACHAPLRLYGAQGSVSSAFPSSAATSQISRSEVHTTSSRDTAANAVWVPAKQGRIQPSDGESASLPHNALGRSSHAKEHAAVSDLSARQTEQGLRPAASLIEWGAQAAATVSAAAPFSLDDDERRRRCDSRSTSLSTASRLTTACSSSCPDLTTHDTSKLVSGTTLVAAPHVPRPPATGPAIRREMGRGSGRPPPGRAKVVIESAIDAPAVVSQVQVSNTFAHPRPPAHEAPAAWPAGAFRGSKVVRPGSARLSVSSVGSTQGCSGPSTVESSHTHERPYHVAAGPAVSTSTANASSVYASTEQGDLRPSLRASLRGDVFSTREPVFSTKDDPDVARSSRGGAVLAQQRARPPADLLSLPDELLLLILQYFSPGSLARIAVVCKRLKCVGKGVKREAKGCARGVCVCMCARGVCVCMCVRGVCASFRGSRFSHRHHRSLSEDFSLWCAIEVDGKCLSPDMLASIGLRRPAALVRVPFDGDARSRI
jgi:hypothetical protein